jgi:hypothetical protein
MKTISGFTFVHNAIDSGYPIVEAIRAVQPYVDEMVVVDMQSTDATREVLHKISANNVYRSSQDNPFPVPLIIIDGYWGNEAGETLRQAHNQYKQCNGDVIIHFEADEVFDDDLIKNIIGYIHSGTEDIAVHRLQLEQNFQRCRWYPELVHRVFPRISNTRKEGHTTNRHNEVFQLSPSSGYLWDITNCFRDNWLNRVNKQAQLRNDKPQYLMVPEHCCLPIELDEQGAKMRLNERHWQFTSTPFNIPEILKPLVGATKYEPRL